MTVQVGATVQINGFSAGKNLSLKLRQYGLFIGDTVKVLRIAPFAGPILLEINGREIALGRGIAAKVMVEKI